MGLVAVLAAGQAADGIIAVRNHFGLFTLQGAEAHAAQGVVLVLLAAVGLRAAQGEVIQLAEVGVAALQDQRLSLVATAKADAALSLAVQGVGFQGDVKIQVRRAQSVQVATAVGMPVHCGQVAELTLLRGAVGGQGMLLLPLPGLAALKGRMALLLADQPLGVVVSERDLAVITGHACLS